MRQECTPSKNALGVHYANCVHKRSGLRGVSGEWVAARIDAIKSDHRKQSTSAQCRTSLLLIHRLDLLIYSRTWSNHCTCSQLPFSEIWVHATTLSGLVGLGKVQRWTRADPSTSHPDKTISLNCRERSSLHCLRTTTFRLKRCGNFHRRLLPRVPCFCNSPRGTAELQADRRASVTPRLPPNFRGVTAH